MLDSVFMGGVIQNVCGQVIPLQTKLLAQEESFLSNYTATIIKSKNY